MWLPTGRARRSDVERGPVGRRAVSLRDTTASGVSPVRALIPRLDVGDIFRL
jgi:hypothetical protein